MDVRFVSSSGGAPEASLGLSGRCLVSGCYGKQKSKVSRPSTRTNDYHQTLELLEGKSLFDPIDRVHNQYVLPLALAQYIGYLGPPPLDMIKRSPLFQTYFDEAGKF